MHKNAIKYVRYMQINVFYYYVEDFAFKMCRKHFIYFYNKLKEL